MHSYGTAQFKLDMKAHACACAHLMCANFQNLACACTVAHNFNVHMQDGKYTQHTRYAHHKLTLSLPHYMCSVTLQVE